MIITFMIGNGFDIASGLRTTYEDFYKWYCQQKKTVPCIEQMQKDIKDYVEQVGNTDSNDRPDINWADLELAFGKYSDSFSEDKYKDYLLCHEDLQISIAQYITEISRHRVVTADSVQANKGLFDYLADLSPADKSAIKQVFKNRGNEESVIRFLSFNYSSLFDSLIRDLPDVIDTWEEKPHAHRKSRIDKAVIHVHGTLEEYPILGVEYPYQITNKALLSKPLIQDVTIKDNAITGIGQYWKQNAISWIDSSNIICLFGLSLGETDGEWWEHINQWLIASEQNHLIIFWYNKAGKDSISILKALEQRQDVQSKLFDYSDFTDEMIKKLEHRVHIVINAKDFLHVSTIEETKLINAPSTTT